MSNVGKHAEGRTGSREGGRKERREGGRKERREGGREGGRYLCQALSQEHLPIMEAPET